MYPPKRKKNPNFAFSFTNRIGKRPTVYPKMQFYLVKKMRTWFTHHECIHKLGAMCNLGFFFS